MYTIVEKEYAFGYYYEKYYEDELQYVVKVISVTKQTGDFKYLFLLDSFGRTILEVFKYLNYHLETCEWKKREKALQALKALFTFVELYHLLDYKNLSEKDLKKLITFLEGGDSKGNETNININTTRIKSTTNQYMSVYRDFYKFLDIKDGPFFDKRLIGEYLKTSNTSAGTKNSVEAYSSNQKINKQNRIPKYIRIDEYLKILELIKAPSSNYELRELIIVKLMYEYGLRISEVLGITDEDIKEAYDKNNNKIYKIILRNRTSDKQYQICKNLKIPKSESDYMLDEYLTIKVGYHEVVIEKEIVNLIREYIDESRNIFDMSPTALKNMNNSKADIVEENSSVRENHYLFISKNYTPITGSGWNKILRQIYSDIGIELDKKVRKHNLNHRMRHGYAMLCVKYGIDKYTLKELLRHRRLSSVDIYFNPTVEDNIEMAVEVSNIIKNALDINVKQLREELYN